MDLNAEIRAAIETMGRDFNEFKTSHEAAVKAGRAEYDEKIVKLTEVVTKAHEKLTEIETKQNRPVLVVDENEARAEIKAHAQFRMEMKALGAAIDFTSPEGFKSYKAQFGNYLRFDVKRMSQDEVKALSLGSDPEGGYFMTPPEISNRITKRIFETTPMRDLATVQQISAHELKIPQDPNSAISGGWVGELTARPQTPTSTIAMKAIVAYEQYAQPAVSQQLLEDSAIDVEAYYAEKTADIIARTENTSFVSGTGAAQPKGFLKYPAGTNWGQIEQVGSGTSGSFTYLGLIKIMTSLKEQYHANASWLFKRASLQQIMTLQDGNGRYIFQPIVGGNFNNTALLGYTLRYANDMPAVGAGALAGAFGDFKRGYIIVDRVGLSVLRDAFTSKPNVLFYTRKRTGGDVDDFDAIKLQVLT